MAENYPVVDETIQAGDIVAISDQTLSYNHPSDPSKKETIGTLIKAQKGTRLLGAVSTKPGMLFGYDIKEVPVRPVALSGRIPVKVSSSAGEIKIGDYITSGDIPGVGVKATESGEVIGVALEAWDGNESETGKITVFMNLGYQRIEADPETGLKATIASVIGSIKIWTIDRLTANSAEFANIKTNTIEIEEGIKIKDKVTGDYYCITVKDGDWSKVKGNCSNTDVVDADDTDVIDDNTTIVVDPGVSSGDVSSASSSGTTIIDGGIAGTVSSSTGSSALNTTGTSGGNDNTNDTTNTTGNDMTGNSSSGGSSDGSNDTTSTTGNGSDGGTSSGDSSSSTSGGTNTSSGTGGGTTSGSGGDGTNSGTEGGSSGDSSSGSSGDSSGGSSGDSSSGAGDPPSNNG